MSELEIVMDEAFWDERYRSSSALWSGDPNPNLVAEAAGLTPGAALDVGCGEGADAVWLAGRGWRVTAVDLSTVRRHLAHRRPPFLRPTDHHPAATATGAVLHPR